MTKKKPPEEKPALEDIRQNLRAARAFYSNENKYKREIWVASRFLTIAKIPFSDSEIVPNKSEPPDVLFGDARFEIKELLDEGRRRHKEYTEKLAKAEAATQLQELMEQYNPIPITISEIASRIEIDLKRQEKHYALDVRRAMDILYYVNPQHQYLYSIQDWPASKDFSSFGWRSICFLKGNAAGVFYTSPESPQFLRKLDGKLTVCMHWLDD